jgi:hypothetical protein
MRVAIDLDNTLLEWQYHWADLYQLWFDREVDQVALREWDACVNATHFESHVDFFEWFEQAHGLVAQPWVPGGPGALFWMQQERIPFMFVTARHPAGVRQARELAKDWQAPIEFLSPKSKHLAAASVWIDDAPDVLENLVVHGKTAIRLERPWNEGAPATFSAATWPEIVEILKEIQ